jgi:protein-disulfide isomerase
MAEARLTVDVTREDHIQGDDAPVTLLEYGDFECPHCGRAHGIVKDVQREMGDKLRFVFRNFPLSQSHPHAKKAAEAAEIAASQGKFWEMHDMLYENQDRLSNRDLTAYATQIGLDVNKFDDDLMNGRFREKVESDFMSGIESGVNGTPTFFINGVRHEGRWELNDLLGELQRALGQSAGASAR